MKSFPLVALALTLIAPAVFAQKAKPRSTAESPALSGAKVETYKTIGDVKLDLYLYAPPGHQADDRRPAIVFFFGGGWKSGSPKQFERHCEYLAARGMVAITADYRVLSRHGTKADRCVADGKSAIRWVRAQAARLGVDPDRIAAGGGSAGGHVAACTGLIEGMDETGDDLAISSAPNAMILFNPAVVLAPVEDLPDLRRGAVDDLRDRMGIEPARLSPYHHVKAGAPPMLIVHGKGDTTVPFATVEAFTEAMLKAGNRCELAGYEGQPHGFFNFGRGDNKYFVETVRRADQFLVSLGYLKGKETIREFVEKR